MNDQRTDLIWPNEKLKTAGLRKNHRQPQVGMVGFVVGCLSPNHAAASSDVQNILLVKVDDDLCIPISSKGVKEYKTFTSPPLPPPKNQNDEQEPNSKDNEEQVTL